MKTSILVDLFDLYGKDIPLQIFGAHKQKSLFGAFMGVASIGFIAAVTVYFLTTLFSRDTKVIITSQDNSAIPKNDMTDIPFTMTLSNSRGEQLPPDPSVWEVVALNYRINYNNNRFVNSSISLYDVHPCTPKDFGDFPNSGGPNSLCVAAGDQNKILNSKFNDITNGWNTIEFILTKCDANVKSTCKNRTYVDSVMEGAYFAVFTRVSSVDNDNSTKPNSFSNFGISYQVSSTIYKLTRFYFTQNLYTDDNGFVFESLVTYDFFTAGNTVTEYFLTPQRGLLPPSYPNIPVTAIFWNNSPFVQKTRRTFLKAQAILANIGGIVKFIMVVAQIITGFVNRKYAFIQIANEVFDYNPNPKRGSVRNVMMGNDAQKSENILEIEGRSENVVPIPKSQIRKKKTKPSLEINSANLKTSRYLIYNKFRTLKTKKNESPERKMKLSLWEELCVPCCVKNKKMMNQYALSEQLILERVSIHSIFQNSYKLDCLSQATLDAEALTQWKESKRMPFYNN